MGLFDSAMGKTIAHETPLTTDPASFWDIARKLMLFKGYNMDKYKPLFGFICNHYLDYNKTWFDILYTAYKDFQQQKGPFKNEH